MINKNYSNFELIFWLFYYTFHIFFIEIIRVALLPMSIGKSAGRTFACDSFFLSLNIFFSFKTLALDL